MAEHTCDKMKAAEALAEKLESHPLPADWDSGFDTARIRHEFTNYDDLWAELGMVECWQCEALGESTECCQWREHAYEIIKSEARTWST